jgi:two-component system, sensor histidine kinase
MHPLLSRQIEQCRQSDGSLNCDKLYDLIGAAYSDDERTKARMERALRLMSEEMEEANQEIARRAMESVTRFMTNSKSPLLAVTSNWTVVFCNEAAAGVLGAERRRDIVGRNVDRMFTQPERLVKLNEASGLTLTLERLDGRKAIVEVLRTEVSVGEHDLYVIALRDKTEQLEREATLKAAKLAAEQANAQKSSFLAMMSHELRTPLNALLGSAELLKRTTLDERQASYVRMFNDAGQLLLALVNDVLDYSKIEAGLLEIEASPTSLPNLVHEVEALWAGPCREKGIGFETDTSGLEVSHVLGDPTRLRQIVFNLTSNAVKFTSTGQVDLRFSTHQTQGGIELSIVVKDTGIGIPEANVAQIFEAFVQADSSITRKFGGTGLGLTIARSLARQMGGDLCVSSRMGEGSQFTFTALLQACHADEQGPVSHDEALEDEGPVMRVLAVDDNALNRQILAAMLELWPVEVTWATNGAEAVDACARVAFDVVLMDVQMPVMDGHTATRHIRASNGPNRNVPIVALTANARSEDQAASYAAGMTDFVAKPIRAEALMNALVRASEDPIAEQNAAIR